MGLDTTQAARHLASLRPRTEHVCVVCGKAFEGTGRRQYCSGACKARAFYRRRRGLPIADAEGERPAGEGGA